MSATSPLGAHSWSWAVSTTRNHRWGQAVLPVRPNGTTGWINLRGLHVVRTATWVLADLSRRTVTLMQGDGPLVASQAAIGTPALAHPTGRFSRDRPGRHRRSLRALRLVRVRPVRPPAQPPPGWSGGDQLAIHGTNAPSSIGTAASAGCLRVSAAALGTLRATCGWARRS